MAPPWRSGTPVPCFILTWPVRQGGGLLSCHSVICHGAQCSENMTERRRTVMAPSFPKIEQIVRRRGPCQNEVALSWHPVSQKSTETTPKSAARSMTERQNDKLFSGAGPPDEPPLRPVLAEIPAQNSDSDIAGISHSMHLKQHAAPQFFWLLDPPGEGVSRLRPSYRTPVRPLGFAHDFVYRSVQCRFAASFAP